MRNVPVFILAIFLLLPRTSIQSQTAITPQDVTIGVDEHLDEYVPLDIWLINEQSDSISLEQLVDKPTIINLVYYRCPGICSPLMEGLADVMEKVDLELGKDYQVLTISFDPTEPILLAQRKKNNYLNLMQDSKLAEQHWKFFVGDSLNLARLTEAVGFKYKRTGLDFIHAASITVLSPEGKITRYLNGTYFLPFEIKMAVIEASQGKSSATMNKILQYCYSYDPMGQKYVMNITKVSGTLIIFVGLFIFLYLVLKTRLSRKKIKAEVN